MPVGPKGEKRPRDVVANGVLVAKIAVGEADEQYADDAPRPRVRRKVVRPTKRVANKTAAAVSR